MAGFGIGDFHSERRLVGRVADRPLRPAQLSAFVDNGRSPAMERTIGSGSETATKRRSSTAAAVTNEMPQTDIIGPD